MPLCESSRRLPVKHAVRVQLDVFDATGFVGENYRAVLFTLFVLYSQ